MKSFMIFSLLLCCGVFGLAGAAPNDCPCGDVNCDGVLDANDGIYILNYLCGGGPAPLTADLEHADWDGHQYLTLSDVLKSMWPHMFGPHYCPASDPPLDPPVDTIIIRPFLHYIDRIRGGAATAKIALIFNDLYDILGFTLPLRVRIDNQIPTIDSVVFTLANDHPYSRGCYAVYSDSGCLVLGAQTFGISLGPLYIENIATLFLSVPPDPNERLVTVEWANLTPVQAPAPDNSVGPMIGVNLYEKRMAAGMFKPVLVPTCCILAGDVNDDGAVNIGDAVYLITYVFRFGPPPPCMAQADPNNDGRINIGDAVFLISYIFRGGPAPMCQ